MPYYNQPEILRFTLPVWRKVFPHEEIIIVDDGSEKKASDVVKLLNLSATVIYQKRNGYGTARALNLGYRLTHSDRILFTNCDIVPNFTYADCSKLSPNIIRCFIRSECKHIDVPEILTKNNPDITFRKCFMPDIRFQMGAISDTTEKYIVPILPIYCYGFGLSVPKYMVDGVGGFCENVNFWGGEDILLCLQIEDKFPEAIFEIDTRHPVLHLETKDRLTKRSIIKSYQRFFPPIAKKYLSPHIFSKYEIDRLEKPKAKKNLSSDLNTVMVYNKKI